MLKRNRLAARAGVLTLVAGGTTIAALSFVPRHDAPPSDTSTASEGYYRRVVTPRAPEAKMDRAPIPAPAQVNAHTERLASKVFGPEGLGTGIQHSLGGLESGIGAGAGHIVGLGTRGSGAGGGGLGFAGLGLPSEPIRSGEGYQDWGVNGFISAREDAVSTFAIDVDTASYALSRRKLRAGMLPPTESVRVEEFLNYFRYDYPSPDSGPLAAYLDAAPSPFQPNRYLLRVGLQAKRLSIRERKPAHLTFLVDVSGSMQSPDKLPLAQRALRILLDNLNDGDSVALVTYAGNVRVVLPPTGLEHKARIAEAIDALSANGSTAMGAGLTLAYQQAMRTLDAQSESRVIVLSDGDANVGATSHDQLLRQIASYVKKGVTLSTVGFGMGNYQDNLMEQLADKGNGNAFYVDSVAQARRVFQEQLGSVLEVVAQDVKIQVAFDSRVVRYRLVGYENRDVADTDFRNDKVDAGELGAGHTVTALYEVELAEGAANEGGWAVARVRAKAPRGEVATERQFALTPENVASRFEDARADLRFATAVMATAEVLRQSPHARGFDLAQVSAMARDAAAGRAERVELQELIERAQSLLGRVARQ